MTAHVGAGARVGVYADLRYELGDGVVHADHAFIRFLAALAPHVGRLVVFGRAGQVSGPSGTLRREEADFVALPDYPSLTDVAAFSRAVRPSLDAWRQHLGSIDVALVFGPHPLSLALVRECELRGVPVVLGVRQDFPAYLAHRAAGRSRAVVAAVGHTLEHRWRLLARRHRTIVTGADLAWRYGNAEELLDVAFSLVPTERVTDGRRAPWGEEVTALSVGRLDPEKNPLLLAEICAGLGRSWPGWHVRVVGDGSLAQRLDTRRRALRLGDRLELAGAVRHGEALWEEYRRAEVFLHVSHTEGQPQVLLEAMAAGLPIVATAVGGVPSLLDHGARGLLVPPDDAGAAVAALERLRTDPELRRRLVAKAREFVLDATTEVEASRVARFVTDAVDDRVEAC